MAKPSSQYRVQISVDMKNVEDLKKVQQELTKIIDLQSKLNQKAGVPFDKMAKSTKKTQIEMRKFGRGMQNASYQVQDFIVQVSGGVDPLRSFSQQAPQLLINMGALGAVVGVVAAALPLVIQQFTEGADQAEKLSDAIADLEGTLNSAFDTSSTVNMKAWIDQWNNATRAVRTTMLSVLEFDTEMANREFTDALESMASDSAKAVAATWKEELQAVGQTIDAVIKAGISGGQGSLKQIIGRNYDTSGGVAEALGITPQSLSLLEEMIDLFDDGNISIDKYNSTLRWVIQNNEGAADSLSELEKESRKLITARDKLIRQNEKLGEASGGGTLSGGTEGKAGRGPKLNRVTAQDPYNATFKQAEANLKLAESYRMLYDPLAAYEAELEKIISVQNLMSPETTAKAVEAAADAYEKATEQITFAQQAAEVFQQSFDTAFQGVAMGTQDVSDAFRNMAKVIIAQLLKIAAYKTIAGFGFGGEFGGQVAWGAAQGGVVSGGNKVQAFASGGIVNGPTAFGMSRGRTGLMGEAGPEMIAPVKRMPNGDMGVGASPVNVTVNNNAAGVETIARQDSNGGLTIDVVLKQAAQAIQSGGNVFADSLEKSYSLNRGRSTY